MFCKFPQQLSPFLHTIDSMCAHTLYIQLVFKKIIENVYYGKPMHGFQKYFCIQVSLYFISTCSQTFWSPLSYTYFHKETLYVHISHYKPHRGREKYMCIIHISSIFLCSKKNNHAHRSTHTYTQHICWNTKIASICLCNRFNLGQIDNVKIWEISFNMFQGWNK